MKKILSAVLSVAVIMVCSISVFAAGINSYEKQILDTLRAGINLNGTVSYLPAEYINQAENYLNTSVDITQAQAQEILGYIEEARALVLADGADSIEGLKSQTNEAVFKMAQQAAAVLGLKLTISGNKVVVITDAEGNVVFKGDRTIKTTGAEFDPTNAVLLGGAILVLIALAGVATRKYVFVKE